MEYKIGEFAQITRLSIKTLRYYHDIGILIPEKIDSWTNYRIYGESQKEQAEVIKRLRNLNFTIREIQEILSTAREDEDIVSSILEKTREVQSKLQKYKKLEQELTLFISYQEEIKNMKTDQNIEQKRVDDQLVAGLRYHGSLDEFGKYIGKLMKTCQGKATGGPFSLYHNSDTLEGEWDIEICVPVKKVVNKNEVVSRILPATTVYSFLHYGSYDNLGDSYKRITDHIKGLGKNIKAPIREIYKKGPGFIFRGNPDKYITEIQVEVED